MRDKVTSFEIEHARYKAMAEKAIAQVSDSELRRRVTPESNTIAIYAWHVAGNLASKFTDFLTANGEKPDRDRDGEFENRDVSRSELLAFWEQGWTVLFETLRTLNDEDLSRTVEIGARTFSAHEALCRSLIHAGYHVGQIVFVAKQFRDDQWVNISIPKKPRR